MSHLKDTDYLALSSRLHVLETRLLGAERMERMIEARDGAEAAKGWKAERKSSIR